VRPFITDDQIAARLRTIASSLRQQGLERLVTELDDLVLILEETAA
jgi:hypothetical protein